jgi:dienelactone hydrolase
VKTSLLAAGFAALLVTAPAANAEQVEIPAPEGTMLVAHWLPHPAGGMSPAVVALHGCGGLYNAAGNAFDARYPEYAERLHRAGYHVLLPDSFGSRGSGGICAIPAGQRTITVEMRRGDAIAAVDWLARQPTVDPQRIVLLGWSHGASTLLTALNAARPEYARNVAAAVAFYPGCSGLRNGALTNEPFRLQAPLLMLLGEKDDWTPPGRCLELAERVRQAQPGVDLEVHVYPDSYHGFDSSRPVRFRAGIPNGTNRNGVHQGGNPEARDAALRELDAFLASRVGRKPGTTGDRGAAATR